MTLKESTIEVFFTSASPEISIPDTKVSLSIECSYTDITAILLKLHPNLTNNLYIALESYVLSDDLTLHQIIKKHDLSLEKPLNVEILFRSESNDKKEHEASSPISFLNTNRESILYGCHDGSFSVLNRNTNKQPLLGKLSSKITAINYVGTTEDNLVISSSDGTIYQTEKKNGKLTVDEICVLKGSIVNTFINHKSCLLISGLEEGSIYYADVNTQQNPNEISKEGSYLKTCINKQKYTLNDFIVLESGFDIFTVLNSRKIGLFDLTANKGNLIRDYLPAKVFSTCVRQNNNNVVGLGLHNGVKFIDINSKRNDHKVIPYKDIVTGIQFVDENRYYTSTLKGQVCESDIRYEGVINNIEIGSDVYSLSILKESNKEKEHTIVLGGDSLYTI